MNKNTVENAARPGMTRETSEVVGRRTRAGTRANGPNTQFYAGARKSAPSGEFIDAIHQYWWHRYDHLEAFHGYIQWLFPNFESNGMNSHSHALTKEEACLIREDWKRAVRFVKSYRMILNFYGMVLLDEATGEIGRHPNVAHWTMRSRNMDYSSHNHLRITRILTSLGQLGFAEWKEPLVKFLEEQIKIGELENCKQSFERFWKETLNTETKKYARKTLEEPADRAPSIFFHHLKKNTKLYQQYKKMREEEDKSREQQETEAIAEEEEQYANAGYEKKKRTRGQKEQKEEEKEEEHDNEDTEELDKEKKGEKEWKEEERNRGLKRKRADEEKSGVEAKEMGKNEEGEEAGDAKHTARKKLKN